MRRSRSRPGQVPKVSPTFPGATRAARIRPDLQNNAATTAEGDELTALSTFLRHAALVAAAATCALAGATTTIEHRVDLKKLDAEPRSRELLADMDRLADPLGIEDVALAPDGAHAALIAVTTKGRQLLLMDIANQAATPIREYVSLSDRENIVHWPIAVRWLDAAHMIVDWSDRKSVVTGLDGERGRTLGIRVVRQMRKPDGTPDDWFLVSDSGFLDHRVLHRVNARTGEETTVPLGLGDDVVELAFDRAGHLRAALTRESKWFEPGATISTWYRHDEATPWQRVQKIRVAEFVDGWHLAGVEDDADRLLVFSRDGRDTWALFRYEVAAGKLGELVIGDPQADVLRIDDLDRAGAVRVVTGGLRPVTHWQDPQWERLQRGVDKLLPAAVNELEGDPKTFVRIFSHSGSDPGRWLMLDVQHRKLVSLGQRRLGIERGSLNPVEMLTYDAPDGLKIPAYLARPAGPAGPRPLVVLIHGGPTARDEWRFDFDVQLLAAAGYAVLQPQFRGSTGFGKAFEVAGYRQWGRAMQDDITAGVKAMIERGVADPDRVCVYGASYGGYAAMWGLAKTPELYKCGISESGVSDIGELFTDWSVINDDDDARQLMRFRVGDVDTMKAQFDEVSPTLHADRIRVPVLIGHGMEDRVAPLGHAKRLISALEDAHGQVDAHFYAAGHDLGWWGRRHFALLAVQFLDRNIGPASPLADRWVAVPAAAPAASAAASTGQP